MSRASNSGAKLITSYRAATSMRSDQRARALRKLQARLSADPSPMFRPEAPVPELPPPLSAAWVQLRARWQRLFTLSKVFIGAALLTWLATDSGESAVRTDAHASSTFASPPLVAAEPPQARALPPDTSVRAASDPAIASTANSSPASLQAPPRVHRPRSAASASVGKYSVQAFTTTRATDVTSSGDAHAAPVAAPPAEASAIARSERSDDITLALDSGQLARAAALRRVSKPRASGARSESQVPERAAHQLTAASLEQETVLMEQVQAALQRGDADRALHLLAEHTWLFPEGHLAEARDVARMIALCQAGHAEQARTRAKRFLAARPHSPFAARVRSSCPDTVKGEVR